MVKTPRPYDKPKDGDVRKTYLVNEELADKINAISFYDRSTVKEVVNQALREFIERYEKKNGPVKVPGK